MNVFRFAEFKLDESEWQLQILDALFVCCWSWCDKIYGKRLKSKIIWHFRKKPGFFKKIREKNFDNHDSENCCWSCRDENLARYWCLDWSPFKITTLAVAKVRERLEPTTFCSLPTESENDILLLLYLLCMYFAQLRLAATYREIWNLSFVSLLRQSTYF